MRAAVGKEAAAEESVRYAAMQVLVKAFITSQDDVQQAAANGIMMVDHPGTPQALATAASAVDPALQRKVDALQERFANPPLMGRRR